MPPQTITAQTASPSLLAPAPVQAPSVRIVPSAEAARDSNEEVSLIAAMQESLRAGDPARVLSLVRDHERRFPTSSYGTEREGARVMALCMGSLPDEARKIGARFLGDHPLSTLSEHVRDTCQLPHEAH
jgi:hypothetical protein